MLESYAHHKRDSLPGVAVAVWLEHAKTVRHDHFEVVLFPEVTPSALGRGWKFLGFDVADQHLTSSLAGLRTDRDALRESVGPKLNEHGLFRSREDAVEFEGRKRSAVPRLSAILRVRPVSHSRVVRP